MLRQLAEDSLSWVRLSVASNPSTPADVLADLAYNGDTMVRLVVAENASSPKELLEELALTDDPDVISAVSVHPNTTDTLARSLGKRLRAIERERA